MPITKCLYCSVDADIKSLKKYGTRGMVMSEAMRAVLCELYFSVSFDLSGDKGATVVEGMSEAVVEGYP
jgi:hypothetical protein